VRYPTREFQSGNRRVAFSVLFRYFAVLALNNKENDEKRIKTILKKVLDTGGHHISL
jgi:hypothetical protein